MHTFTFDFTYRGKLYQGECKAVPIDGSTELHVTPLDSDMFEAFGVRQLLQQSDGSISAQVPSQSDKQDYVFAIADGLAEFYNKAPEGPH